MIAVVLDSTVLSHFARAGMLELLERILAGVRVTTTSDVLEEIRDGLAIHPTLEHVLQLGWIEQVQVSGLEAIGVFAEYRRRLDLGESSVLTWAELHHVTAVVDENAGRMMAKERDVSFMGSLGLIAHGVKRGILTMAQAAELIDDLRATKMFLPCNGAEFPAWAQRHGLFGAAEPESSG